MDDAILDKEDMMNSRQSETILIVSQTTQNVQFHSL